MLILGRKKDQIIMIGHDIEVMIIGKGRKGEVRVGIKAPPEVPVHRKEVYDAINTPIIPPCGEERA